jgi:beta-glucanase (GH16 family)
MINQSMIFLLVSSALSAYCPVIDDDFSSGSVDESIWTIHNTMDNGGNDGNIWYTNSPKNVFVKDSTLHLAPTFTYDAIGDQLFTKSEYVVQNCTSAANFGCAQTPQNGNILPPIQSGKLTSKKTIRYGKVEVVAQNAAGDWLWPAIWMLPKDNAYGTWPASGEMDLMESHGNLPNTPGAAYGARNLVTSDLVYPDVNGQYHTGGKQNDAADYTKGFHTYGLLWTDTTGMFNNN